MTRIVQYDPFRMLRRGWWNNFPFTEDSLDEFDNEGILKVDVYEEGENLILEADIPGVKSEDLDVSVTSESATIRAQKEEKTEEKSREYTYRERRVGSYARTVNFPVQVQPDKVEAECKDGTLRLTMPKQVNNQPKSVKVNVN